MSTHSHPNSSDGARPEHGALARCEYGLLAPEEPAGEPAAAGHHRITENPKDTIGTGGTKGGETGPRERKG